MSVATQATFLAGSMPPAVVRPTQEGWPGPPPPAPVAPALPAGETDPPLPVVPPVPVVPAVPGPLPALPWLPEPALPVVVTGLLPPPHAWKMNICATTATAPRVFAD